MLWHVYVFQEFRDMYVNTGIRVKLHFTSSRTESIVCVQLQRKDLTTLQNCLLFFCLL